MDDTHTPLEVLGPRCDNGRERHSRHSDECLRLEESEQRQGVRCDVSGGIGVAHSRRDGRGNKADASDDGGGPSDGLLINSLSVREFSLDTSEGFSGVGRVDVDLDLAIEIRNTVCDACRLC